MYTIFFIIYPYPSYEIVNISSIINYYFIFLITISSFPFFFVLVNSIEVLHIKDPKVDWIFTFRYTEDY